MRSVYLGATEDNQLRQIAFDAKLTKSDLIRAAIAVSLRRWDGMDDSEIREEVAAAERLGEEAPSIVICDPPSEPAPAAASAARRVATKRRAERRPEVRAQRVGPSTEAKQPEHKHRELASPQI